VSNVLEGDMFLQSYVAAEGGVASFRLPEFAMWNYLVIKIHKSSKHNFLKYFITLCISYLCWKVQMYMRRNLGPFRTQQHRAEAHTPPQRRPAADWHTASDGSINTSFPDPLLSIPGRLCYWGYSNFNYYWRYTTMWAMNNSCYA